MWIPPFLRPLDLPLALVALAFICTAAISLERLVTYIQRGRELARLTTRPGNFIAPSLFDAAWQRDVVIQLVLTGLRGLGPLAGLIGTVYGILVAFGDMSGDTGLSVQRLAPGIAVALRTTLGGALVACLAVAVSALPYDVLRDREAALINAAAARTFKPKTKNEEADDGHGMPGLS